MFRAFEIENFKGISDRVRIELNRLTLLFGPNSAGKSTILHALAYLYELLEHGEADVHETRLGGSTLDLGGFDRLVHGHDVRRTIKLRMEWGTYGELNVHDRPVAGTVLEDLTDPDTFDGGLWMELSIRDRRTHGIRGPIVDEVLLGEVGEDEPLLWLEAGHSLTDSEPIWAHVNLDSPRMKEMLDSTARGRWQAVALPYTTPPSTRDREDPRGDESFWVGPSKPVFALSRAHISKVALSALPPLDAKIKVISSQGVQAGGDHDKTLAEVQTFFEIVLVGTTRWLAHDLRDLTYVGPIRTVPSWYMLDSRRRRRGASWADGVSAWERLLADDGPLVERTNEWLARLGVKCKVVIQRLHSTSASADHSTWDDVDHTLKRLVLLQGSTLVLPSEVGTGISQIIPVIVALLDRQWGRGASIVVIEQPELHVHPALQGELGDLLIEWMNNADLLAIIETHSEHLILRLLRRIRENHADELPPEIPSSSLGFAMGLNVLYVEPGDEGTQVRRLRVDETGEFLDPWPGGFFEERMKELF